MRWIAHRDCGRHGKIVTPGQRQCIPAGGQRKAVVLVIRADQLRDHPAILIERLLNRRAARLVAGKAQSQRRIGQRSQRGEIMHCGVSREKGLDVALGAANPRDPRGASHAIGRIFGRE